MHGQNHIKFGDIRRTVACVVMRGTSTLMARKHLPLQRRSETDNTAPSPCTHCGISFFRPQQVWGEHQSAVELCAQLQHILQPTDILGLLHFGPYRHSYSTILAYYTSKLRLSTSPLYEKWNICT